MTQYIEYKNNHFTYVKDPVTKVRCRTGQSGHKFVEQQFVGGSWVLIGGYDDVAGDGCKFREGVRDGNYVVDKELEVGGFLLAEDEGWDNIGGAEGWSSSWATHLFDQNDLNLWIKEGTRNGIILPDTINPGVNDANILLPYLYKPNGDEYAFLNDVSKLEIGTSDFTICGWIKSESSDKTAIQILMGKHWNDGSYSWYQTITTGFLKCFIQPTGGSITIDSGIDFTTLGWVFIRFDINQTTHKVRLFINEIQSGTDTSYTGTFPATNESFGLGNRSNKATYISKTSHSDTYIYPFILTPIQGATLMARGFVAGATTHWTFSEKITGDNDFIYDVTGNGNHLIPRGINITKRKFGLTGSRYLLDKGYTHYHSAAGDYYIGLNNAGTQIAADSVALTDGYTYYKIKNHIGNLVNHNLADSMIDIPIAVWDRSNTTIFENIARTGYYDASNPDLWHPTELTQQNIYMCLKSTCKCIDFIKMSTDSIYIRDYLQELFSYNTIKIDNNLNKILLYTNDYDYLFAEFGNTLGDIGFQSYNSYVAQYFNGKTYIAYSGNDDDPYITYYNHSTGLWATPVKIGVNPLINGDWHGTPSLLIDLSGYIHIMWGAHSSTVLYSKSTNPEDISLWTPKTSPIIGSYFQLMQLSNGDIYMFCRYSTGYDWGYKKSTDGGSTWGAYVSVLLGFAYCLFKKGTGDTIHCSVCGDSTTLYDLYNIYYLWYDGTVWKNVAGINLTLPVGLPGTDIIVYNSGTNYISTALGKINSLGIPYIFFMEGIGAPIGIYTYKILRYNGITWDVISLGVTTPRFSRDASILDIKAGGNIDVYLTLDGDSGLMGGNLEKWTSSDNGTTWNKVKRILTGNFIEPLLVLNYNSNGKIVFCEFKNIPTTWTRRGYLWGDNGFVKNFNL
jgi:hypothetical protein